MRSIRNLMLCALGVGLSLSCATLHANELGPLIELLIKKDIITTEEAEELRAELSTEYAATPAGKLSLPEKVKQLRVEADLRTRYQHESVRAQGQSDAKERNRWRYRLKMGWFYKFSEGWSAGIQVETSDNSDSTNTDFGGYFDKEGDDLFLGQVYLDYSSRTSFADLINFTVGKKKHPFMMPSAVWDSDINPEGFTQQMGWIYEGDHWLKLRAGQYLIDEVREDRTGAERDRWLFVAQAEYQYHLGLRSDLRIAPYILVESGGTTSSSIAEGGNTPSNENHIPYFRNMAFVALPVEWKFHYRNTPQQLSAAVGMNLKGDDAILDLRSPYRPTHFSGSLLRDSNNLFFQTAYRIGSNRNARDWMLSLEYRYLGAAAITPNLSDSDFGKNRLNQKGFILSGSYMISDSVKFELTYLSSEAIRSNWRSQVADASDVDLIQVDLSAKF